MKNYCGKDCVSCAVREAENCLGCRHIADFGECEIASCCKDKGHESCPDSVSRTLPPQIISTVKHFSDLFQGGDIVFGICDGKLYK
ncbi:MAG: hypothetical protein IJX14_03420 [Clostridia bacterium]|nr:hypothetical protein [Clostridia bacterium]